MLQIQVVHRLFQVKPSIVMTEERHAIPPAMLMQKNLRTVATLVRLRTVQQMPYVPRTLPDRAQAMGLVTEQEQEQEREMEMEMDPVADSAISEKHFRDSSADL